MPTLDELKRFIHKLHYRTFEKIMPHVKEEYGDNVDEDTVRDIIKDFVKDIPNINKIQRKYYNKIFSPHPHAWMMDILINNGQTEDYNDKQNKEAHENTKQYPKYYLIFININTRFVVAIPLNHKKEADVEQALDQFLESNKCVSLTSDKESAFISKRITEKLKQKNISQYIVLDDNHTTLAILDSFIRHLRDMNITNEKSKYQSHHGKYRNFSIHRMNELIEIHNNTIHSATHMKPVDMEKNIKAERQYIANCLIYKAKKSNHDIPEGHFVRIVLAKEIMKKRRFKVSREVYKITGRDGKSYLVSAQDGTTIILPRHRLIDIGETPEKYKFAETIPGAKILPTKILSKNPTGGYNVELTDGTNGTIRKAELRRHHPQIKSELEKDYNNPTLTTIRFDKDLVRKHQQLANSTTIHLHINPVEKTLAEATTRRRSNRLLNKELDKNLN